MRDQSTLVDGVTNTQNEREVEECPGNPSLTKVNRGLTAKGPAVTG